MSRSVKDFGTHIVLVTGPIASGKSSLVKDLCSRRGLSSSFVHFSVDQHVAQYIESEEGRNVLEALFGDTVFDQATTDTDVKRVNKKNLRQEFFLGDKNIKVVWETATTSFLLGKLSQVYLSSCAKQKKRPEVILVECAIPDFILFLVGKLTPLFVILTDREQKDILRELLIRNPDYTEKLARRIIEVQDSKLKTFKPGIPVLGMRWSSQRKKQNDCARSVSGFVKLLQHGV
jgi:dephospho-CoA kinase